MSISDIVLIITATPLVSIGIKNIIDFFDPVSRQLKINLAYEKNYSKYYDASVKDYLKSKIRYLSLLKLTKVKQEKAQVIYLEILKGNNEKNINFLLLSKILNLSEICGDEFVELPPLEYFNSKARIIRKINYYFTITLVIISNLIVLPASFCYDFFILAKNLSVFEMILDLLLIVVTPVLISSLRQNVKPISKKELVYHFAIIEEWNKKIRK